MISLLVWLMLLSSGSVLCAVLWERKYEEIMPITGAVIIIVLFLFGLLGKLELGFYLIVCVCALIYGYAVVTMLKRKNCKHVIANIVTPAACIFGVYIVIICYCNYGRRASAWDEFSHWMDIVKVMSTLDAFGTHPEAESVFQSYPPGMVLFQYFFQKVNALLGGITFSEWRAYVAYQTFFAIFSLPLLKKDNYKNKINIIISALVIFVCPILFYKTFYKTVYIDAILGILAGIGMATVYLEKHKDHVYDINISVTCIMLVLMKDAGLLFAVFLGLYYWIDYCMQYKKSPVSDHVKKWLVMVSRAISVFTPILLTKLLWKNHLKQTKANISFSTPYNFEILLDAIVGNDQGYRAETWRNFWGAFLNRKNCLTSLGIEISFLGTILIVFALLLTLVLWDAKTNRRLSCNIVLFFIEIISLAVYIIGLCFTYMTRFSEYEAVRLASFERYLWIGYTALWITTIMIAINLINRYIQRNTIVTIALCLIFLVHPIQEMRGFFLREEVKKSIETYEGYNELIYAIQDECEDNDRVYLILQETSGYGYWLMRYSIRPVKTNPNFTWSVGTAFYEGDIFTREISREEWREELLQNYDYVAIQICNEYFLEEFGSLFDNSNNIKDHGLYKINRTSGLLECVN